jgi:tRNA threonylcarbamoyladenosine modification (KEOPS) complex Cgi121 subunit
LEPLTKTHITNIIDFVARKETSVDGLNAMLFLNYNSIAGINHLQSCILFALEGFQQKTNIANKLGVEIMLFLSSQRQIVKGIKLVGLDYKTKKISFVIIVDEEKSEMKFTKNIIKEWLNDELQLPIKEFFQGFMTDISPESKNLILTNLGISETEIEALGFTKSTIPSKELEKLAIEKSALLNLEK